MTTKILLCYASKDEEMARNLKNHLSLLERNGRVALWDYGDIGAGTEREQIINKHLSEAQIILLLISSSLFDPRDRYFLYGKDVQQAIERHERKDARVIPVLLRSYIWDQPPFDKLSPLPDNAKFIAEWRPQDKGFVNVAQGIIKVLEQWDTHTLPDPTPERRTLIAQLDELTANIESQMQPSARAVHVAGTIRELSVFIPTGVTLADLIVGWQTVARPSNKDESQPITNRRATCDELAKIAAQLTTEQGSLDQAIKTWDVWQIVFANRSEDRYKNMTATFKRELTELQAARTNSH